MKKEWASHQKIIICAPEGEKWKQGLVGKEMDKFERESKERVDGNLLKGRRAKVVSKQSMTIITPRIFFKVFKSAKMHKEQFSYPSCSSVWQYYTSFVMQQYFSFDVELNYKRWEDENISIFWTCKRFANWQQLHSRF